MMIKSNIITDRLFIGDVTVNREYKLFFDYNGLDIPSCVCPYCENADLHLHHNFCYNCGVSLYFEQLKIYDKGR